MNTKDYFLRSQELFANGVKGILPEDLHKPTPCTEWDVEKLVQHLVFEELWMAPMLNSIKIDDVTEDFEALSKEGDVVTTFVNANNKAVDLVNAHEDMMSIVHTSYGDITAEAYLTDMATDHLIHAWDLLIATNEDAELPEDLVEYCYEIMKDKMPEFQTSGMYKPSLNVADDASTQVKLLGLFGRDANWKKS